MRSLIEERWGIRRPEQWQAKHVRWCIERALADLAPATRYAYWRTARAVAAALGHWPAWEPHLCGPWTSPTGTPIQAAPGRGRGGRPPKLAGRAKALRERDLPAGGGGQDADGNASRSAALASRALSRPSSRAARSRASAAAARALA